MNSYENLLRIAETEVGRALRALPEELREEASQVPVTYEPYPSGALLEDGDLDADILGLFVGEAFPDVGMDSIPLPAQIILFIENLWDFAEASERTYRREVRKTYLHELGHYLGLDEDALFERGME